MPRSNSSSGLNETFWQKLPKRKQRMPITSGCSLSKRSWLRKQAKLALAESAELALRKERRILEEEKQRLELEVERRLEAERLRIREATQKEEEQSYLLKLAEKDKLISDMKKQVEELRRKGDQSSQQLQGEVLELELEAMLRTAFPGGPD